jgi:hypothetical protein
MTVLNRLLGLALGLALLGGGFLAVVEAALAALDRSPWLVPHDQWGRQIGELTWDDRTLVLVAGLTVLTGVVLLVAQLWPARPSVVPIAEHRPHRLAALDGRGFENLLRRTALEDEDVLDARVRLRRRSARVSARAPGNAELHGVQSRARERVQARVDELGLQTPLGVKLRVQHAKARVR